MVEVQVGLYVFVVHILSKLVIAKANLDDEADYTVIAGSVKSTASLLVDGEF